MEIPCIAALTSMEPDVTSKSSDFVEERRARAFIFKDGERDQPNHARTHMLSRITKLGVAAGLLALGLTAASAVPADAAYYVSRCDSYGCYRVRCHDDGFGCTRVSPYYSSDYMAPRNYDRDDPYYHATSRYLCNSDGDDCYWTHSYRDGFDYY
jgi:hypothetical protein